MAVSSLEVGSIIGGQQAMFGNYAAYAQQINPGYQGPPPLYGNPVMLAGGSLVPPPSMGVYSHLENIGTNAVGLLSHVPSAMTGVSVATGLGAMITGSRLLGAASRATGVLDPFYAALGGFSRGIGWQAGAGISANLSRIAAGGIGRAALGGIAGAAGAAFFPLAASMAIQYAGGEMLEGARFQRQVSDVLLNQFRFYNPAAMGGYGFTRQDRYAISDMLREMGHHEILSTPGEMLRILQQGAGMQVFRAVNDVRAFRAKFREMVSVLKEIAQTMNTTLEGALPFFGQARQMGFWTPQDIIRSAQMARGTAAMTGLSVAQVQGTMLQGAQMARAMGSFGAGGAVGAAKALNWAAALVGGPGRPGIMSEQEVAEMTGGLQGPEAAQAIGQSLLAATAYFARSTHGRWTIAALGGRGFRSLDPEAMRRLASGNMTLGELQSRAWSNIGREGAIQFVMNEEQLRGRLMEMGPEAQLGFVRSFLGERLYSDRPYDQLLTRRMMERYFGLRGWQADVIARMAREAPQTLKQMQQRTEAELDQQQRQQQMVMHHTWDGVKRRWGKWWDDNVNKPLQEAGAAIAKAVTDTVEGWANSIFNRPPEGFGPSPLSTTALSNWRASFLTRSEAPLRRFYGEEYTARPDVKFLGRGGLSYEFGTEEWLSLSGTNAMMRAAMEAGLTRYAAEEKVPTGMIYGGQVTPLFGEAGGASPIHFYFRPEEARQLRLATRSALTGLVAGEQEARALGYQSAEEARAHIAKIRETIGEGAPLQVLLRAAAEGKPLKELVADLDISRAVRRRGENIPEMVAMARYATALRGSEELRNIPYVQKLLEPYKELGGMDVEASIHSAEELAKRMREVANSLVKMTGESSEAEFLEFIKDEDVKETIKELVAETSQERKAKLQDKLRKKALQRNDSGLMKMVDRIVGSEDWTKKLAVLFKQKDVLDFRSTMSMRMERVTKALSGSQAYAELKQTPVKEAFQQLVSSAAVGPEAYRTSLENLVRTASKYSTQATELAQVLSSSGLGIYADVLQGAAGIQEEARMLATSRDARTFRSAVLTPIGLGNISSEQLKALMGARSTREFQSTLRGMGVNDEALQQYLSEVREAMASKNEARLRELLVGGRAAYASGFLGVETAKSPEKAVGRRGTPEGIHQTLESIDSNVQKLAARWANTSEGSGGAQDVPSSQTRGWSGFM
jgi:hypothetical protein